MILLFIYEPKNLVSVAYLLPLRKIVFMQTASLLGVLKLLAYFFIFYFLFKIVMRLLLPILMKKAVEKAQDNFRRMHDSQQFGDYQSYQEPRDSQSARQRPKSTKKVGEYIDYEEID